MSRDVITLHEQCEGVFIAVEDVGSAVRHAFRAYATKCTGKEGKVTYNYELNGTVNITECTRGVTWDFSMYGHDEDFEDDFKKLDTKLWNAIHQLTKARKALKDCKVAIAKHVKENPP